MSPPEAAGPRAPHADERLHTPSLVRRVTLTVLGLVTVMLLVLGLATSVVVADRLDDQLRQRLLDRATVAAALADTVGPQELVRRLEGDGVSVTLLTEDDGTYTAGPLRPFGDDASRPSGAVAQRATQLVPGDAGPPGDDRPGEDSDDSGDDSGDDETPGPPPLPDPAGSDGEVATSGSYLQVSQQVQLEEGAAQVVLVADAADVDRTVTQVRIALVVGAVVVLLLTAGLLGPVVSRALRPLDRITSVARSIGRGDRGRRLRPERPRTELGRTAVAFDEMLEDVEGAEARARASEQRLRAFLSDAAHELRTPVTAIQASAEHLLRSDPPRAERERVTVTLIQEARRAGRLVEDMLLMGVIDRGLDLRPTSVDLHALADRAVGARAVTHPGATWAVEGPSVVVQADGDRVTQVLGNLLDNAVQAAGPSAAVTVTTSTTGHEAVVEVADDGPGVAEADRERIFERLVRVDAARQHHRGGAGLGLAIARGVARAHGGDLVCVPSAGGARFRLTLPR